MKTEDLVLNDGGQRQVVKQLGELLPDVGVSVLAEALVIETIPIKELVIINEWAKQIDIDFLGFV